MKARSVLSSVLIVAAVGCARQEPPAPLAVTAAGAAATDDPVAIAAPAPAPGPAAQPAPRASLATAEGSTPGLQAELTELRRSSGGTVTLRFTVVNATGSVANLSSLADLQDLTAAGARIGGVHLIDPVGKKKYFVARDAENACVCSGAPVIMQGASANLWAKFPAPPEDVQRISVVLPGFSPMDDVPISR
jgi:hypothetical protein